ncbi:MAG: phosphatase PAP2 family protein [Chitinophagaceae bacterium]|nr:phosphatase PAP2 family protein [Chitinophagaceae bacterium]MCW5904060.1 phosphatase PAP2 family protein [Chitinophagaceae bacterium]
MTVAFIQELVNWFDKVDKKLFLKVNTEWTTHFLDTNLPWYRDATTWLPLYLFVILYVVINYGKKAIAWIIAIAIIATISDQISSSILKNLFGRIRPCSDIFIQQHAGNLLLNFCPSSFSLPSSHAVNHFTAAIFIFLTLKPDFKKWSYLFFIWAASICYAQVYVGVHYPLDVFIGAIIGCTIGGSLGFIFNKYFKLQEI